MSIPSGSATSLTAATILGVSCFIVVDGLGGGTRAQDVNSPVTASLTSGDTAPSDKSVSVAAVTPLSSAAPKPWLTVIIQATLVEMGCGPIAVSGQWDAATQQAAARALAEASVGTEVAAAPSDDLLHSLRVIRGRGCSVASLEEKKSSRETADERQGSVVSNAAHDKVQMMGLGAEVPRSAAKPAVTKSPKRPAREAGPAVFVRPVGVGSF